MNKRTMAILVLALLVALVGSAPAAWAQFGVYGQVKGKVIGPGGEPVVGAEILFVNLSTGRTFKLKTDKRGEFFGMGFDPGEYDITVSKDGRVLGKIEKRTIHVGQFGDVNNAGFRNNFPFNFSKPTSEKGQAESAEVEKAKAGYEKGVALNRAGRYEEALAELQPLAEKDPNQWAVHAQLGVAYRGLNRLDDAVVSLKRAIELQPTNATLHSILGEIYLKQKKTDEARQEFETAAQLSPEDAAGFYYNLAVTFYNANEMKAAIEPLQKVVELDPAHANAHFYLGVCLFNTAESKTEGGQVKMILAPGTREHFETYLALAPNGPLADQAKGFLQAIDATVPASVRKK